MIRKLVLPLLMLTLMLWVVGCSTGPSQNDVTETPNIEEEFGGYLPTSESPGFGDTELLAEDEAETEVQDDMLSEPAVAALVEDPESGMFHFRAVWGQLRYDSTVTKVTDWTGTLTISRGAIIIRKTIKFELGQDYIPTRTDRQLLEWVSYTTVHHDGVAVDLFVPPALPTYDTTIVEDVDTAGNPIEIVVVDTIPPDMTPVTVAFETGPYSRTFSLAELAALDTIVYLEDSSAVAIHGNQMFRLACPRGFVAGAWGVDSTGQGVFRGRWMSQHGYIQGYLNGQYGVNDDGERVLYGKWINRSGRFEGLLAGTYDPYPNTRANGNALRRAGGWFKARIFDANENVIGAMKGHYKSAPYFRGGFFQGRWKLFCDEPAPTGFEYDDGMDSI